MMSDEEIPESILIVDDDERNILSMTTLLARPNRELLTAMSGTEALKILQRRTVDLILLDVQMPGPSGFDTAELIRSRPSLYEIPIIFVSAAATSDEYVSKGFASGAYDYIVKPVQADLLENKVEVFLELYRTKKKAKEYASWLHNIIFYSSIAYASINASGKVVLVSPAFESTFGVSKEDVVGISEDLFEQSLSEMGVYQPLDSEDEQNNGEEKRLLEIARPAYRSLIRNDRAINDESGRQVGKLITFQDVTRERELDRMKSDFLSIAAHELRTPLATIMGYSELLLSRDYEKEQAGELLGVINRQSQLLAGMINDLMDLSLLESRRSTEIQWKTVKLESLLKAAIESVAEPGVESRVSAQDEIPEFELLCDEVKAVGAIRNVLSNALKYSSRDQDVIVRILSRLDGEEQVYGINVIDRGIGMTREELDKIFERFYRADKSGNIPGTGLGMSLVKEVMNIHGGYVEIESKKGKGTSVTLWFRELPPVANLS